MLPTLAEVLALDPVRRGEPEVLAGGDRLDAPVRWVHAIELADAARLLRGGELVLATGIGLPDAPGLLASYVAELAAVGASGLVVELGRRYLRSLPPALVDAASKHGLPLIALARETAFVEITEAVHARIIDAQMAELRESEHLHEVFTQLAVAGARAEEIVRQSAALAGKPVVLESLAHQVLACEPATADPAVLLAGWESRARAVAPAKRTAYDRVSGWLVTTVGARGEDWGRLIFVCGGPPEPRHTVLIERAATTLALARLLEHQRESLERQAHRTVLAGILAHAYADPEDAAVRTRALGVPVAGRRLLGVVIRAGDGSADGAQGLLAHRRALAAADAAAAVCREIRVPALVGSLDDVRVGALLALPQPGDPEPVLARLAERLRGRLGGAPVVAAGSATDSFREVRRSFMEAIQVADAAAANPDGRLFYRLPDLRLRGLLHLLRDDPRVQTFAERELGPLLAYDDAHRTKLTQTLAAYLEAGGNKAEAAARAGLARPTLYQRLGQIESVLGASLGSAQSRLSLHVALLALDSIERAPGYPRGAPRVLS
jgi:PucR family transcriptional regulator, purine catabolism regulatory protein